jgi:hypothetical protein
MFVPTLVGSRRVARLLRPLLLPLEGGAATGCATVGGTTAGIAGRAAAASRNPSLASCLSVVLERRGDRGVAHGPQPSPPRGCADVPRVWWPRMRRWRRRAVGPIGRRRGWCGCRLHHHGRDRVRPVRTAARLLVGARAARKKRPQRALLLRCQGWAADPTALRKRPCVMRSGGAAHLPSSRRSWATGSQPQGGSREVLHQSIPPSIHCSRSTR